MNGLSIRITQREGDTVRSFDIDTFPPAPPVIELAKSAATAEFKPPRFVCNDGMVHDLRTGLIWSQDDVTEDAVNWKAGDKACKALRLGGFEDWRLPTREELLTLVDDTRHSPAIDTNAFPSCKSAWYWTGTDYAASPSDCAWGVTFGYGYSGYGFRDGYFRVRAVRRVASQ